MITIDTFADLLCEAGIIDKHSTAPNAKYVVEWQRNIVGQGWDTAISSRTTGCIARCFIQDQEVEKHRGAALERLREATLLAEFGDEGQVHIVGPEIRCEHCRGHGYVTND